MDSQTKIVDLIRDWDKRDIANLAIICDLEEAASLEDIEHAITWAFHSKARHTIAGKVKGVFDKVHASPTCPTYEELLRGAAKVMQINKHCSSMAEYEMYLPDAVIVAALSRMTPPQRREVFTREVDAAPMWEAAGVKDRSLRGVRTTASILALANASGFAVYAGATTALGFITHAVGITLPFAVYTGMSSTIGVLIGPPGWMALAAWGFFTVTGSNWKILMPLLLSIIQTKSRLQIQRQIQHQPA
ncbi:hypothetical protein FHR99_003191 [Litorivivens lipolytica]|uniref:Uncharacterized protein n=1 Tax=Litorivivens lipolytica TaxID=1524264 RepID=A0A7W4Z756_9GAMM|nr:hypothetical protein [Litorivivens lipolytica]MBB3048917.1 hypothetical protein [Litorivivens lipolytica]